MSTRRVGIDLGSTAVRVVEVNGLDGESLAQVTRAAIVPLQPGAISAGRIKDPTAVAWALSRALKESRISPYGVVLGLTSTDTALARVVMPGALTPTEWAPVLRTSDKPISPKIPIGRASLSMYPISEQTAEDGTVTQRTLLTAAALTDQVAEVLQVCRLAKVTPRAIDLAAAATMRCLTRSVPGNDDVATLVDIGATKTTVVTRQGLDVRSVRTIDIGGHRITQAVMGATDTSYDRAEELKLSLRMAPAEQARRRKVHAEVVPLYGTLEESTVHAGEDTADIAGVALTSATTDLINAIAAAIETDASAHPLAPTQGVLLCGGASLLRGLKEQLSTRTGVPAIIGRPWARVVASKRTEHLLVDGVEDEVVLLSLATAIGLATWKEAS